MPAIAIRHFARRDLDEIWDYIADDSVTHADAFIELISRTFSLPADRPDRGRRRDELMPELRAFPCQRYVIFYRASRQGIEVVRVLHGARDVTKQFASK